MGFPIRCRMKSLQEDIKTEIGKIGVKPVYSVSRRAAWAAASRAIGTRGPEQDTYESPIP